MDDHKLPCRELLEEKTQKLTPGHGKSDFTWTEDLYVEDQSLIADGLSQLLTAFTEDLQATSRSN